VAFVKPENDQNFLAALFPLENATYLRALPAEQLFAATSLPLKLFSYGFGVALILFACACLAYGSADRLHEQLLQALAAIGTGWPRRLQTPRRLSLSWRSTRAGRHFG